MLHVRLITVFGFCLFFFSSRRRHTRCALVTGVQTCALPICNLLPRGMKLAPEDVWNGCAYVLSVKMQDPQFAGQTKERLSSRESAAFVQGVVHDAFSLWLNQHTEAGEQIAQLVIANANARLKLDRKRVV